MNLDKIRELAYTHLADRKAHKEREKGFIFYHGERTGKIAVKLRELLIPENPEKDDILIAAGLFHDIAKGIEPHGEYGSLLAREILKDHCSKIELDEIAELIYYHQKRKMSPDFSDYIKIFQDADTLDHFGTIEFWVNFHYYSYTEQPISESVKFYQKHFEKQVEDIRQALNYELSIKIFDEKITFAYNFTKRMAIEAEGEIYGLEKILKR